MKIQLILLVIMGLFSGLFSCKSPKTAASSGKSALVAAIQNPKSKSVIQTIAGKTTEFHYGDFENLPSNKAYDAFEADILTISSGKIVCTDPLYRLLGFPQNWTVAKGNYPVTLYIALSGDFAGRVAYAELTFSQQPVDSWELSLLDETFLTDSSDKELNGYYPVENGLGCFADADIWKRYDHQVTLYQQQSEPANFYKDVLAPLFEKNKHTPASSRGEDWANYTPPGGRGNIIMFGSGYGDGFYPRYVGFDRNHNPVKLITDFIQLGEEEE